jgi:hypothetical protein
MGLNRCLKAVLVPTAPLAVSAAVVVPSATAGAQTPPRDEVSLSLITGASNVPTSTIKKNTDGVAFHPTSLSATYAGPTQKTCVPKYYGIVISNGTGATRKITYNGAVEGILPAHRSGGICFWGTESQNFVFGLKGPTSTLTVSVSS